MASSLEVNKMLAAVLTAGIIASGSGVISRIIYSPHMPEESAYPIEVAESGEDGAAEDGAAEVSLPALLAAASVDEGQAVAKKCQACHDFAQGGANKIGPALWGVLGRDIAAVSGFSYSDALAQKEGAWTYDDLGAFLADPKGWAPGTKMAFAGVKDPEDRADLILYLHSLAESPQPLPEVPPEAATETAALEEGAAASGEQAEGAAATGEAAGTLTALLAGGSAEEGQSAARVCSACHAFEEGAGAKIGPHLWGVIGRDIASADDFSYSSALSEKEGAWDYEALDAFLANPREWAPGTKMAFAGVKKPESRADIILYLRSLSDSPEPLPGGG
jgi:cytochrome c